MYTYLLQVKNANKSSAYDDWPATVKPNTRVMCAETKGCAPYERNCALRSPTVYSGSAVVLPVHRLRLVSRNIDAVDRERIFVSMHQGERARTRICRRKRRARARATTTRHDDSSGRRRLRVYRYIFSCQPGVTATFAARREKKKTEITTRGRRNNK
uniref:Uncharacterized protein n=1 Tax=Sipha flava TaxID=143950 RepID=A0A2S2PX11_9HEMI